MFKEAVFKKAIWLDSMTFLVFDSTLSAAGVGWGVWLLAKIF